MRTAATITRMRRVVISVLALVLSGCGMLPTTAQTTPAAPKAAAIGSEVRDGKFAFVVSQIGPPEHWYGEPPQGQWIMASMTISNVGDAMQTFSVGNVRLIDTAGRAFTPTAPPSFVNVGGTFTVDLNPGFGAKATVMWDVPPGTPVAAVELHDSPLSSGVRVAAS